ncbi:MAG: methyltransferase domain-containing protein [Alphaproteobacteria bacterium]
MEADTGALNLDHYPGKYAEETFRRLSVPGPILEAGCGAGRVVRYYHSQGRDIVGMDFIALAVQTIHHADPIIPLIAADIERLPFRDRHFACVLAFGLYHNLEHGAERALRETRRVIKPNGLLCAAVRLDNVQNRVIDWLANRSGPEEKKHFHKINYTESELIDMFSSNGFSVEHVYFVENMPFLFKFRFFRADSQHNFSETKGRAEGYKLSALGNAVQNTLMSLFPASFCNAAVVIARAQGTRTAG